MAVREPTPDYQLRNPTLADAYQLWSSVSQLKPTFQHFDRVLQRIAERKQDAIPSEEM